MNEEERQNDIERDLMRFYARNPDLQPTDAARVDSPGVSPLDMGTLTMEQALEGLDVKSILLDFHTEFLPLFKKRLVWDIVPDDDVVKYQEGLGVIPGSEAGNIIEEAESSARRQALLPLMPLVQVASLLAADIVTRAKMLSEADSLTGDTMVLDPAMLMGITNGVMAVIANLLDLNILAYGRAIHRG